MWFDLVLIDRVFSDGTMASHHIRSDDGQAFPVDRLEDIDSDFRAVDVLDHGTVRIYGTKEIKTSILSSRLKNFVVEDRQILLQLEHINIPVRSGYYAIVFPRSWRVTEINIYDPYHSAENVAEKRSYRNVDVTWDSKEKLSCAQFDLNSFNRETFSIGVIASIAPENSEREWIGRESPIRILISDVRHQGNGAKEYSTEAKRVIASLRSEPTQVPGINVSALGIPSINIVEWGRYIKNQVRRIS